MHVDDFRSGSIEVESLRHGTLELSEFILKDISWLDQEHTQNLSPREFAVQLIHTHLLTPQFDIQDVRSWEDEEIVFVAIQWLHVELEESKLHDTASFKEIKDAVYTYYDTIASETRKQLDDVLASQKHLIDTISKAVVPISDVAPTIAQLGNMINLTPLINNILLPYATLTQQVQASLAQQISANFSAPLVQLSTVFQKAFASTQLIADVYNTIASSLPNLANITSSLLKTTELFAGLPDLTELAQILKEAEEGGDAFKKAGYSFMMSDYVSVSTARRFASIHPKVRSAVITSQLAAETRKPEFEQKLKQLFENSSVLRRRWRIVSQALQAHRRREYNTSIPAILPQIEGIIGDALILNGLVASQGHKLYAKEHGKLKRDRKHKPIEVRGVGTLIQHSSWQTHPALQGVADLITTQLAGERNHILHGRKTNYGAAKLSVQGLLLLLVLAAQVIVFETGKVP